MTKHSTPAAETAVETPIPAASLVSLSDWIITADGDAKNAQLAVLRLSTEPAYVSLFTDQGADVRAKPELGLAIAFGIQYPYRLLQMDSGCSEIALKEARDA